MNPMMDEWMYRQIGKWTKGYLGGINGQIDVIILYLGCIQELFKLVKRKEKSFVSNIFLNLMYLSLF